MQLSVTTYVILVSQLDAFTVHLIQPPRSIKRIRAVQVQFAPIALGWATFSFIFRRGWDVWPLLWWAKVFIQRLRLGGGAAPFAKRNDAHNTGGARLWKRQNIARRDSMGGFRHLVAIHTHMPGRNQLGRQAARFEKPRMPKPFVQADFGRYLAQASAPDQPLSFSPIRAAANGLSGSICSFFFCGLAENVLAP